jgi:RNA polymerase sigma-70 factor (ECF subfamily)
MKKYIDQVLQGDPNAFEMIVRQYEKKIFAFCYYMLGNRQEAEDAAQEAFLKAYQNLKSYQHHSDDLLMAWLYKIAANHCRTLHKKKKRWLHLMPLFGRHDYEKSAEQVFSDQAEVQLQLLEGLSAEEREILVLRVIEDRPYQVISAILDISEATVRKRFERIKVKLRRNKEQWGGSRYEQRCEH